MANNSMLTIDMITREAVELFRNSNEFIQNIDTQYDSSFGETGAKSGDSLRIRLPNDYVVRDGKNIDIQDTTEQQTTLTMATQRGIDIEFNSKDRLLELDDFSERILMPMLNNLTGDVAATIMGSTEGGVANFLSNVDGSSNIITPTAETWLEAGAVLDVNSAPKGSRKIALDPFTRARTVSSLSGLFNPAPEVSQQYRTGEMLDALGFMWFSDQTVLKHTTGTFSAGTVSGAGQTGTTLTVNAITGTLAAGDIITLAGVNAVNRVTKQTTGELRHFVVTAAAANGATSLSIYPAIVPPDGSGNPVQYQTVTASPANSAVITLLHPASGVHRKNIVYCRQAVTMVSADLQLPTGVEEGARQTYDGVSMRMISDYQIGTDEWVTRLDVLFGWLWVRPEWAVVVADRV